ncbi:MAG TPA: amidohydrolase family protein [Acidimicrobiales bacterium]|nr:amidohydrolase family protein [Acidimicrobiales bacterium]
MLDLIIRGGTVVDGTGVTPRPADVGVSDGRVVAVAEPGGIADEARDTFDATGLMVCPGFVDPHTHYDAQLFWDPLASPSNVHGVTSIVAGNCGFTLAPLHAEDADYLRRMMARVEGMPLAALEQGVPWDWESFAEYLDRLDGRIGVNAGFMVGHCALRRYVMGADAVGHEATPDQLDAMVAVLHESIGAGGLGFSTTLSSTHSDGDGQPVASRHAGRDELLALCAAVGEHDGTFLEGAFEGGLDKFSDDEIELVAAMSAAAGRSINWNVLTVDSAAPDRVPRQLGAADRAAERGGRVVALTMPVLVPMNMSFGSFCALWLMPGWGDILRLPPDEKKAALADPEVRAGMVERSHSEEAGVFRRLAGWDRYVIGDTYSAANEGLTGRIVGDIAAERGQEPFDTLVEIVADDDFRTVLWPMPTDNDDASWRMRQDVWGDPRVMLGGSDAGAHLDRMCGSSYTTRLLADCLRGRKLTSLERAVQMLTQEPAALFGLVDRGTIAEGAHADLVVFDPETVGAENAHLVDDLPGGTARLTAGSEGVVRVYVGGVATVEDGKPTGATPGRVLRSGRDTVTVGTN